MLINKDYIDILTLIHYILYHIRRCWTYDRVPCVCFELLHIPIAPSLSLYILICYLKLYIVSLQLVIKKTSDPIKFCFLQLEVSRPEKRTKMDPPKSSIDGDNTESVKCFSCCFETTCHVSLCIVFIVFVVSSFSRISCDRCIHRPVYILRVFFSVKANNFFVPSHPKKNKSFGKQCPNQKTCFDKTRLSNRKMYSTVRLGIFVAFVRPIGSMGRLYIYIHFNCHTKSTIHVG